VLAFPRAQVAQPSRPRRPHIARNLLRTIYSKLVYLSVSVKLKMAIMVSDESETGQPASIETVWGLRDRPRRGPVRGLSLEKIVEAAVKVALAEGLAAVSMHRVATELGTSAMTLYRYVASKDELLALMADAAAGAPSVSPSPDEGWREALSRWAWAELGIYQRNPWLLHIPISGPPATPHQIAWLDQGLRALHDTGLTEAEKLSVILLLTGFVRNEASQAASLSAAVQAAGSTTQEAMSSYARLLARVVDSVRFPALRAAIDAGAIDAPEAPDENFTFGLERILDGIEALIRSRTGQ